MKTCGACFESKPYSDYYAHPKTSDGYLDKCKECHKARIRAKRLERVDYYRQYDSERAKTPKRVAAALEQSRKWRQEDRRRTACHNAVARALRAGTLQPKDCEKCGSEKSMAHHESYDRKLDVTWLCQPCHNARHKQMKEEGIVP